MHCVHPYATTLAVSDHMLVFRVVVSRDFRLLTWLTVMCARLISAMECPTCFIATDVDVLICIPETVEEARDVGWTF